MLPLKGNGGEKPKTFIKSITTYVCNSVRPKLQCLYISPFKVQTNVDKCRQIQTFE